MGIPESLLMLAGFVFGHAAWILSDLSEGELLVPFAIVETSGQKQQLVFEAETQVEAIAQGKATLKKQEHVTDAWAYAREGQINEAGGYVDVLSIEAKARGMAEPIYLVQRFRRYSNGHFKLIGEPIVQVGGKLPSPEESNQFIAQLRSGVQSHSKASALWSDWVSP